MHFQQLFINEGLRGVVGKSGYVEYGGYNDKIWLKVKITDVCQGEDQCGPKFTLKGQFMGEITVDNLCKVKTKKEVDEILRMRKYRKQLEKEKGIYSALMNPNLDRTAARTRAEFADFVEKLPKKWKNDTLRSELEDRGIDPNNESTWHKSKLQVVGKTLFAEFVQPKLQKQFKVSNQLLEVGDDD